MSTLTRVAHACLTFDECSTEAECRQAEADAILANPGAYNRGGVVRNDLAEVINMIDGVQIEKRA